MAEAAPWEITAGHPPLRLRDLESADGPAVFALFARCAGWFVEATGQPSEPGDVLSLYSSLPEGCMPEQKRLLLAEPADPAPGASAQPVGLVDAELRHPESEDCAVGKFLVDPRQRRRGLGRALADRLLAELSAAGYRRVTATMADGCAEGRGLLRALGSRTGPSRPSRPGFRNSGPCESGVRRAELRLPVRTAHTPGS